MINPGSVPCDLVGGPAGGEICPVACPACRGDRAGDGGPSGRRVARGFRFCPDCGVAPLWPEETP